MMQKRERERERGEGKGKVESSEGGVPFRAKIRFVSIFGQRRDQVMNTGRRHVLTIRQCLHEIIEVLGKLLREMLISRVSSLFCFVFFLFLFFFVFFYFFIFYFFLFFAEWKEVYLIRWPVRQLQPHLLTFVDTEMWKISNTRDGEGERGGEGEVEKKGRESTGVYRMTSSLRRTPP